MGVVQSCREIFRRAAALEERKYEEHDLPMLRVHGAYARAAELAALSGLDRAVVDQIVREVIGIIGAGTKRFWFLCPECGQMLERVESDTPPPFLRCPVHGGFSSGRTLLISFPPQT